MSIIPTNYALVSVKWQLTGSTREIFNVFGVDNGSAQTAQYIAQNVGVDFDESVIPLLTDDVSIVAIKAVLASGSFYQDNEVYQGGLDASTASAQVAYLMRKETNNVGRANHGRMYLPGVSEGLVAPNGTVDSTQKDDLTTAGNTLLAKLTADDIPMVILHSTVGPTPVLVDRLECDQLVATQRRRLRG